MYFSQKLIIILIRNYIQNNTIIIGILDKSQVLNARISLKTNLFLLKAIH